MRARALPLAAVFVGGSVGTFARAGLAELVANDPGAWPWATLIVNVAAALALGFVVAGPVRPDRFPALGPGLCGGLSTFSTLQIELLWMIDAGDVGLAAAYAAASVMLGLAAVGIGSALGEARA